MKFEGAKVGENNVLFYSEKEEERIIRDFGLREVVVEEAEEPGINVCRY